MSSNIEVKRICIYCNGEFIARTTKTLYCSRKCNSRHYKEKLREKKVAKSNEQTNQIKRKPIEELKIKEFLSVTEVSKLIGCSRQNVYKLIQSGKLRATNILEKKTIIRRQDIDDLFKPVPSEPQPEVQYVEPAKVEFDITESYSITEMLDKYSISDSALRQLIKRHKIPKIKQGWYAYVPKARIDKLLT